MRHLGDLIKEERIRKGLSQQKLADMTPGLGRSTISKYENGHSIPHESLVAIIEVLRSPRLRLEALGGAIPCMYLDNIDFHPVAIQRKAIEEMDEAVQALTELNLINKRSPEDLTEEEKDNLLNNILMELQDVNICMDLVLIGLAERFNLDLKELERLSRRKMLARGYRSQRLEMAR